MKDRRSWLSSFIFGTSAVINAGVASAKESYNSPGKDLLSTLMRPPALGNALPGKDGDVHPTTVTLPLEPASGGTFCVRLTVFTSGEGRADIPFRVYLAIVDTGSPYLVLPSPRSVEGAGKNVFQMMKAALALNSGSEDSLSLPGSAYPPTEEIYGAVKGRINWKSARYSFRDPRLQVDPDGRAAAAGIVGVLDDALTDEATGGGAAEPCALLGLIRDVNPSADRSRFPDPRPTFLGQERVARDDANELRRIRSFSIDGPARELTLSSRSLIPDAAATMPLVDLRTVGDSVDHYAVVAESISFDDIPVSSRSLGRFSRSSIERPIVVVFDTGLTGCLLIKPFWDVLQKYLSIEGAAVDELRSVSLSLQGAGSQNGVGAPSTCKISSCFEEDKRFYVQPIDLDWFDDEQYSPYVIILGQTFLRRGALTIDMDERVAAFS